MTGDLVVVGHANPHELRAMLLREVAAGRLAVRVPPQEMQGRWVAGVERLKPARRPRWPYAAVGVPVGLAGAAGLGWWGVTAFTALPAILAGAMVVLVTVWLLARRTGSECTTTITITHSHRH